MAIVIYRDCILVSFNEFEWESRVQREYIYLFPSPRGLRVLSNILKFKGIQAPYIEKKSWRCRASRIAWEFEYSKTWRITNFKGYLKIGDCGFIRIEN